MSTTIKSELMQASINAHTGDIIYTFRWTYPRIILSEVNTHRMLSRNTSSSRAIPSAKQRQRVWDDPFVPSSIGAAKKGMQAGEELEGWRRWAAEAVWKGARVPALGAAWTLEKLGVHKQITNRVIEPWTWTVQLVTATDLDNLFALRAHEMAEPHFQELAYQAKAEWEYVKALYQTKRHHVTDFSNTIQVLTEGEWHLPFVSKEEAQFLDTFNPDLAKQASAARCARVSYFMPDSGKKSTMEEDLALYERLAGSHPKHLSPLEHQATPMLTSEYSGNFKGWKQFRKEFPNESGLRQTLESTPYAA